MNHRPRKRFGQNFLRDSQVVADIVQAINPMSNDRVVEVGPGTGALTAVLAGQCRHLDVVEIDRDLAAQLRLQFPYENNLKIHCRDILKTDIADLQGTGDKIRIIGNLPYNISSPLLFRLLDQKKSIQDMHFMLQKEVVDRICASPGTKLFGKLSVMVQFHCDTEKLFEVAPECFSPAPKVASAFVRLSPWDDPKYLVDDLETFQTVVKHAFGQRRKTLKNALKGILSAEEIISVGVDPVSRAETLDIVEYTRLSNLYGQKC